MKFLNHTQNSLQIIVFQTQFFMILTKNTTKPFPEIPGNRETIPGNETPEISREFPPGNSREASLYVPNMQNPGFDRLSYGVILVWTSIAYAFKTR